MGAWMAELFDRFFQLPAGSLECSGNFYVFVSHGWPNQWLAINNPEAPVRRVCNSFGDN
jgi:hypothetical protein